MATDIRKEVEKAKLIVEIAKIAVEIIKIASRIFS